MDTWVYGLILAGFSIFIKVLGTNLQKLSHRNKTKSYCNNIHWIFGITLTIIGSLLDMGALALAPQSMIASLGGLTLVVNICVAKLLLGEIMRKVQYFTTLVIIIGTTLTIVYAPRREADNDIDSIKRMYESPNFIVYIIFIGLVISVIRIFNYFFNKSTTHRRLRGIIIPISSGMIAAQNMFFGKTFGRLVSFSIENKSGEVFKDYIIYINIACLIFTIYNHIKWINEALKEFPSTLVVPINKSAWIIISILGGIFVMGEDFGSEENPETKIGVQIGFISGILLIVIGLSFHSYFEKEITHEELEEEVDIEMDSVEIIEIEIEIIR